MKKSLFGLGSVVMLISSLLFGTVGLYTNSILPIGLGIIVALLSITFVLWEINEQFKQ